ncbi:hypothetical protein PANDA_005273 [Ailuropoda melanoleuca]|uniref:MAGE domain-containing protein n=1 Tax=Ailuropoda melanoleuca TaxID=9646 RepID=D2H5S9_AILME|nr:hypothetical protein PANDA_005273 [Ailuropoda melanoleuca]
MAIYRPKGHMERGDKTGERWFQMRAVKCQCPEARQIGPSGTACPSVGGRYKPFSGEMSSDQEREEPQALPGVKSRKPSEDQGHNLSLNRRENSLALLLHSRLKAPVAGDAPSDCLIVGIARSVRDPHPRSLLLQLFHASGLNKDGERVSTLPAEEACSEGTIMQAALLTVGRQQKMRHLIFGEPRNFITEDLEQERYLQYRQVANSDPPRYEFLWGPRAHAETSKMRVLELLLRSCKIHDTVPSAFPCHYEEALRDEEERARARAAAGAASTTEAGARSRAKSSSSFLPQRGLRHILCFVVNKGS